MVIFFTNKASLNLLRLALLYKLFRHSVINCTTAPLHKAYALDLHSQTP